jgi:hypothetical protein
MMSVVTDTCPGNKVAAHWARKVENRRAGKTGILDSGATSGAAPVEYEGSFEDSGQMSSKTFCCPTNAPIAQRRKCSSNMTFKKERGR